MTLARCHESRSRELYPRRMPVPAETHDLSRFRQDGGQAGCRVFVTPRAVRRAAAIAG